MTRNRGNVVIDVESIALNRWVVTLVVMVVITRLSHAQSTVYVTMVSHFDRPWTMTSEDLKAFEELTTRHPEMRWTHLYNPVAYTQSTPLLDEMECFVKRTQAEQGAEIGTHLHMYQSLLGAAEVKFEVHPSMNAAEVRQSRDASGYAVPITRYSREEIGRLLALTARVFDEHGLGQPRTFCAGFYATSIDLQREIVAHGYTVSAAAFPPGTQLGAKYAPSWNRLAGWDASITHRLRPYFVSAETILPSGSKPYLLAHDGMPLVEIPQTCKIDWMMTAEEMKVVIKQHLAIAQAVEKSAVCLAIHETGGAAHCAKFDEVLRYIDDYRTSKREPIVKYVTASQLREAFVTAE